MRLIVGLGNPGDEYQYTRHNVGFRVVDALAQAEGLSWTPKSRYEALISDWTVDGRKCFLIKPQTYMNLSGKAVAKFAKEKELTADNILVLHDELDLPLGKIKGAYNRGPAGHNGVRSLIEHLGGQNFYRLRLGIGKSMHAEGGKSHVLGNFGAAEKKQVDDLVEHGIEAVRIAVSQPWEKVLLYLSQF